MEEAFFIKNPCGLTATNVVGDLTYNQLGIYVALDFASIGWGNQCPSFDTGTISARPNFLRIESSGNMYAGSTELAVFGSNSVYNVMADN